MHGKHLQEEKVKEIEFFLVQTSQADFSVELQLKPLYPYKLLKYRQQDDLLPDCKKSKTNNHTQILSIIDTKFG